jgi:hypothetical protein
MRAYGGKGRDLSRPARLSEYLFHRNKLTALCTADALVFGVKFHYNVQAVDEA